MTATQIMSTSIDVRTKRAISLMDRVELEDKHIELVEENMLLKKHAKAQEEKMKRMATKLLRLSSDDKKIRGERAGNISDVEDNLVELSEKLRQMEIQNANLKGKVTVLKQQLESRGKRHTPYDHIPSKINTGVVKRSPRRSISTEDVSNTKRKNVTPQVSPGPVRYGQSLLEEARKDNEELEELVLSLKQEISLLRTECDRYKEENKLQKLSHDDEVLKLQEQLQKQFVNTQKINIEEDIEKIKLQREVREKTNELRLTQTQCTTLENNLQSLKNDRDKLLEEVTQLSTQLDQEQQRYRELHSQHQTSSVQQKTISELQEMLADLKAEKDILKQSNDRLMKSALVSVGSPEFSSQRRALEERVKELERKVSNEMKETQNVVEKLAKEKEVSKRLNNELSEVKGHHIKLQNEHKNLLQKLGQNEKGSPQIDWTELEEALSFLKSKKENDHLLPPTNMTAIERPPIIHTVIEDSSQEVQDLRLAYAETTSELDKTKKLLSLQSAISRDCKKELEMTRSEINRMKEDYEMRLHEKTQLLEMKSTRIKKLESQLKELAYSTKRMELQTTTLDSSTPHRITTQPAGPLKSSPPQETPRHMTHLQKPVPLLQSSPPQETPCHMTHLQKPVPLLQRSPPQETPRHMTHLQKPEGPLQSSPPQDTSTPIPISTTGVFPIPSVTSTISVKESKEDIQSSNGENGTPNVGSPPLLFDAKMEDASLTDVAGPLPDPHVVSIATIGEESSRHDRQDSELSEEEFEEDLTELSEDTMFEDTLQSEGPLPSSPFPSPSPSPNKPSVILRPQEDTDEDSLGDSLDLMSEDDEQPIGQKNNHKILPPLVNKTIPSEKEIEINFSLTIVSFTVEEDSSLARDKSVTQIFIEYQFLDYDSSELETPLSLPKTTPGHPIIFNFKKDFYIHSHLHSNTMELLKALLQDNHNTDHCIPVTIVSDPEGDTDNVECVELGVTKINLREIVQEGGEDALLDEDVHSVTNNDEIIGFLTIKLDGLDTIRQLLQTRHQL